MLAALHLGYVGVELGALCAHRGVYVADAVALGGDEVDGLAQQNLTVYVERLGSRVGEVVTYVAHVGGAEQGVADGVDESFLHRTNLDTQKPHRHPTYHQTSVGL